MGRRLSERENLDNISAIMKFTQGKYEVEVNISIMEDNKVIEYFKDVNIYSVDCLTYMNVNISWEDFYTSKYKEKGLFGIYSTGYNKFYYSEEGQFLKIESSDSDKIIILNKR